MAVKGTGARGGLALLLALAWMGGAAQGAEWPAQTLQLQATARILSFDAESNELAMPQALGGISFAALTPVGFFAPEGHPEWPCLHAVALGEGKWLLAMRFGKLAVAETRTDGSRFLAAEWPAEGIPTHAAFDGKRLVVAAGGAGVLCYEWNGTATEEPRLRGRYPFVDHSKEVELRGGIAYLADNLDTGMQVLDVRDVLRPRRMATFSGGFMDSVALSGKMLAVANRRVETAVLDVSRPGEPRVLHRIEIPPNSSAVRRVRWGSGGLLLACEGEAGARLFRVDRTTAAVAGRFGPEEGAIHEGLFLPDGRLLLARLNGRVDIIPAEVTVP